ncbi:MAG: Imm9 family immunity protein [Casimicrobium sp.]
MKIKRTSASSIFQFPDTDYGQKKIDEYIESTVLGRLDLTMVPEWTLTFCFHFCKSDWIGVFKRGVTYASTKEKEVTVAIPIPTVDQAPYGLDKKRFAMRPPLDATKFWTLPVEYSKYESLQEFILESAKRGIDEAFKQGVAVSGKKIKYLM